MRIDKFLNAVNITKRRAVAEDMLEHKVVFINNLAVKKAKELMNQAKSSHLYIDEDIRNKRNQFKNNNWVDLYKEETEQEERIGSIVMEEIKLIA